MSYQIIQQPDGRLCVWSSSVDDIVVFDADEAEIVEFFVEEAVERATEDALRTVNAVVEGRAASIYLQFTMSFDEIAERYVEVVMENQ